MEPVKIRPFTLRDRDAIADLLQSVNWAPQYVREQLKCTEKLSQSEDGEVWVATIADQFVGYIQVQHHHWNQLSFVHGLIVSPDHRRLGIAKKLVEQVEESTRKRGNRGLYLDTPVNNKDAISFYKAIGYNDSYIMPEYYEPGLDGLTFQKLFS